MRTQGWRMASCTLSRSRGSGTRSAHSKWRASSEALVGNSQVGADATFHAGGWRLLRLLLLLLSLLRWLGLE